MKEHTSSRQVRPKEREQTQKTDFFFFELEFINACDFGGKEGYLFCIGYTEYSGIRAYMCSGCLALKRERFVEPG